LLSLLLENLTPMLAPIARPAPLLRTGLPASQAAFSEEKPAPSRRTRPTNKERCFDAARGRSFRALSGAKRMGRHHDMLRWWRFSPLEQSELQGTRRFWPSSTTTPKQCPTVLTWGWPPTRSTHVARRPRPAGARSVALSLRRPWNPYHVLLYCVLTVHL
jgi:hypothetical protein